MIGQSRFNEGHLHNVRWWKLLIRRREPCSRFDSSHCTLSFCLWQKRCAYKHECFSHLDAYHALYVEYLCTILFVLRAKQETTQRERERGERKRGEIEKECVYVCVWCVRIIFINFLSYLCWICYYLVIADRMYSFSSRLNCSIILHLFIFPSIRHIIHLHFIVKHTLLPASCAIAS